MLKVAVVSPMPRLKASAAATVWPGTRASMRRPYRKSRQTEPMVNPPWEVRHPAPYRFPPGAGTRRAPPLPAARRRGRTIAFPLLRIYAKRRRRVSGQLRVALAPVSLLEDAEVVGLVPGDVIPESAHRRALAVGHAGTQQRRLGKPAKQSDRRLSHGGILGQDVGYR